MYIERFDSFRTPRVSDPGYYFPCKSLGISGLIHLFHMIHISMKSLIVSVLLDRSFDV